MNRRVLCGLCCAIFLFTGCAGRLFFSPGGKKKPPVPTILPRSNWAGGMPSGAYKTQTPAYITILDTPNGFDPDNPGAYLKQLAEDYIDSNGVGDIPVHYIIDQKGGILAGRPVNTVGQLTYGDRFFRPEVPQNHPMRGKTIDCRGHILVLLLGDYESTLPPPKQQEAMLDLIQYLVKEYRIAYFDVLGYRTYIQDSMNPGTALNDQLASLILKLAKSQAK